MDEDLVMGGGGEAPVPDVTLLDQNIDDLFGEAGDGLAVEALSAALSTPPLTPSLVLRMQEKQNRGCRTKLTWSNTGSIAQITDHGRKIEFRCMRRDPKTGIWALSEPSKTPTLAPEGMSFEHIQFSSIGIDLAAADNHGHVRVYALSGALGKMPPAQSNIAQEGRGQTELDVVVGLHWLPTYPTAFKAPYITPATKIGDRWVTELHNRDSNEPTVHHPSDGRHALLHVSRRARLTLMFQIEAIWHDTFVDLETVESSDGLLSHAAMCENGGDLLLVTHDIGKRFRVYKITINWHATQHTRPGGPPYTTVAPTVEIVRLTMLDHIAAQHADLAVLTDLRLISPIPSSLVRTDPPSLPIIVAVFTRVLLPADPIQQHQEAFSIIARWQVESATPILHDSFAKLKPNGVAASQPAVTVLRRHEDNITSKVVLSMEPQYHNTLLAFCASDGTIEFRDHVTMATIEAYGDTTSVSSLAHAGFEHMAGDHQSDITISPDGSVIVTMNSDGSLVNKMMTLRYGWQPLDDGITDTNGLIETAVVCLARQYATLCCCSTANDDILALLPPDLSPEMRSLFIREATRMTNRNLDLASWDVNRQQAFAVRESVLRVLASGQSVINKIPGTQKSTWAGKFGYTYINARLACFAFAQVLTRPDIVMQTGFVLGLRGTAKWSCDFLAWVADSLITLKRATEKLTNGAASLPPHQAFMNAAAEKESPVINILLCTYTRVFVRFLSITLKKYHDIIRQALPNVRSVIERQQMEETIAFFSSLPYKFNFFDILIHDIDNSVRKAHTSNSITTERRIDIELSTMTEQTVPHELDSVIEKLVNESLPKFMSLLDLAALYFRDTTWLGIEPTNEEARQLYDSVRKLPVAKGAKLRVCRRCGAVMEDLDGEALKGTGGWMMHAQRTCVCGNYWIMQ